MLERRLITNAEAFRTTAEHVAKLERTIQDEQELHHLGTSNNFRERNFVVRPGVRHEGRGGRDVCKCVRLCGTS